MREAITPDTIAQLWHFAERAAPAEACGYLFGGDNGRFTRCVRAKNLAPDPLNEFWLHPEEFRDFLDIAPRMAIWHSHPGRRWDLSHADQLLMRDCQVPMVVVAWKPFPAVVLYVLQVGEIVSLDTYRVEGVTL